jgi:hypothetical protein
MQTNPDLTAIEQDAHARMAKLGEARARLALDALAGDEDAKAELANVESELVATIAELQHADLARSEQERREAVAHAEAERAARARAFGEAKALDAPLLEHARKFDQTAEVLARLASEHRSMSEERQRLLHAAGVAPHPWLSGAGAYQAALVAAFGESVLARECAAELNGKPRRLEDSGDNFTA